jgi:hypothetical protein
MRRLFPIAVVMLSACYPRSGPIPATLSEQALAGAVSRWPNENAQTLEQGRTLFSDNCGDCHDHPDVWSVSEKRWPSVMKKMAKEASLKQEEADLILHFVISAQADPRPVAAVGTATSGDAKP